MKQFSQTLSIASALLLSLSGCQKPKPPKPVPNPHPKYFVTISGNIQPNMSSPQALMFKATYAAYHPECSVDISKFEGVKGMPGHPVYYPVYPDAEGNYKVKIPIDAYLPGKCDWKIAWIMDARNPTIPPKKDWAEKVAWGDMIRFGHVGNPQELPGYLIDGSEGTLYCGYRGFLKCRGHTLQGSYVNSVPRNKSYNIVQNIKDKRSYHGKPLSM